MCTKYRLFQISSVSRQCISKKYFTFKSELWTSQTIIYYLYVKQWCSDEKRQIQWSVQDLYIMYIEIHGVVLDLLCTTFEWLFILCKKHILLIPLFPLKVIESLIFTKCILQLAISSRLMKQNTSHCL